MLNTLTKNTFRILPLLLVALVCMSSSYAAKPTMRIYDQGQKEDARVYRVVCEDGTTQVGVSQRFPLSQPILDQEGNPVIDEDKARTVMKFSGGRSNQALPIETCAHPVGGKNHCKARWDINKAARYACQKSKRK
jgi:hypothetical protein